MTVYVKDTYRYSGRGKGGFTMHYTRKQCSRNAEENGYCWQHQYEAIYEAEMAARKGVMPT